MDGEAVLEMGRRKYSDARARILDVGTKQGRRDEARPGGGAAAGEAAFKGVSRASRSLRYIHSTRYSVLCQVGSAGMQLPCEGSPGERTNDDMGSGPTLSMGRGCMHAATPPGVESLKLQLLNPRRQRIRAGCPIRGVNCTFLNWRGCGRCRAVPQESRKETTGRNGCSVEPVVDSSCPEEWPKQRKRELESRASRLLPVFCPCIRE
jgi:hypothetical protein